jgi:hypothetical protein
MMTVNKAIAHLNADKKCCAADPLYPDGRPPLAHTQWAEGFSRYASSTAAKDSSAASFGIFKTDGTPRPIGEALSEFAAEQLIGTCHYTKAFYDRAANWLVGEATAQRSTVFIVSDHQWDEVDKFMRDDVKALSYATAELGAFMKRCALRMRAWGRGCAGGGARPRCLIYYALVLTALFARALCLSVSLSLARSSALRLSRLPQPPQRAARAQPAHLQDGKGGTQTSKRVSSTCSCLPTRTT